VPLATGSASGNGAALPPAPVWHPIARDDRTGLLRDSRYTQSSPSEVTWTMFVRPIAGSGRPAVITTRVPGS